MNDAKTYLKEVEEMFQDKKINMKSFLSSWMILRLKGVWNNFEDDEAAPPKKQPSGFITNFSLDSETFFIHRFTVPISIDSIPELRMFGRSEECLDEVRAQHKAIEKRAH
ncbi:hypothetical protein CFP56_033660 [Quercus suber]|uniref:Uncharacterized protein n=1 Tax=Quercus suber TaxID=58331 RepID=A0AAW0JE85_QUESU